MKNKTEIIFIWDKSGSMYSVYEDALGGFNQFIKDQQKDKDDTKLSLTLFDSSIEEKFISKKIKDIKEFTNEDYKLGSTTALFDAIGISINSAKERFSKMKKQPTNVIVIIQTDGMENSSREFKKDSISTLIEEQEALGWEIIYLGANASAFSDSNNFGLNANNMMDYSGASTTDAFMATSNSIKDIKNGLDKKDMASYLKDQNK